MKTIILSWALLCLFCIQTKGNSEKPQSDRSSNELMKRPVKFIENKGQLTDMSGQPVPFVLFTAESEGLKLFITEKGLTYLFLEFEEYEDENEEEEKYVRAGLKGVEYSEHFLAKWNRVDVSLERGSINREQIIKDVESRDYSQFFYEHCPQGITGVHSYDKLTIKDVYPNIDWVFYNSSDKGFKYDFIVHPGADPGCIKLLYSSLKPLKLKDDGSIGLSTSLGSLTEDAPYSYLLENNQQVKSKYFVDSKLVGGSPEKEKHYSSTVSFNVDAFDRNSTLVIDPQLTWATFYGGTGYEGAKSLVSDKQGNLFVIGYTNSAPNFFPLLNAGSYFQGQMTGPQDCIILRFSNSGVLTWATYYGGTGEDGGNAAGIDEYGNIYVGGETESAGFPLLTPYQQTYGGGGGDAFLIKFDNAGNRLWATFHGGNSEDILHGLEVDQNGNVFAGGRTNSPNFPLISTSTTSYSQTYQGVAEGFVMRYSTTGSCTWSTYYGGTSFDMVYGVGVDTTGNAYVTGYTSSANFPLNCSQCPTAFQNTLSGTQTDAFFLKFSNTGALMYATFFGGTGSDIGYDVEGDPFGNIFISGHTFSTNFPVTCNQCPGYYQATNHGGIDAFITKFNSNCVPVWSTYFGGSLNDAHDLFPTWNNLNTDTCGNVYLSIDTKSSDVPTLASCDSGYYDNTFNGGNFDVLLTSFSNKGVLKWSTYLGGSGEDFRAPMTIDQSGTMFVAGEWTNGGISSTVVLLPSSYPLTRPDPAAFFDTLFKGQYEDMYLGQFRKIQPVLSTSKVVQCGCNSTATATLVGSCDTVTYSWSNGQVAQTATGLCPGTYTVLVKSCYYEDLVAVTIPAIPPITATSAFTSATCNSSNGSASVTAAGGTGTLSYLWNPTNQTTASISNVSPGSYTCTISDTLGCSHVVTIAVPGTSPSVALQSSENVSCYGSSDGSAIVTVSGGSTPYSFSWSPAGGNNAAASGLPAGQYSCTVSDGNGCVEVVNASVAEPPSFSSSISTSSATCGNNNGFASIAVTGGTGSYSFAWSSGSNQNNAMNLAPGSYTCTVTDSLGCIHSDTTVILSIPVGILNVNSLTNVSCYGAADGSASVNVMGGAAPYQYSWGTQPTQTTNIVSNLAAGNYSISVTDSNNCVVVDTVSIIQPDSIISLVSVTETGCNTATGTASISVSGGTGPYQYSWSGSGGTSNSASGFAAGQYSATVTDANGCSETVSAIINSANGPTIILTSSNNVTCSDGANGSATISISGGSAPYNSSWSPGGMTGTTVAGLQAGNYNVTVTDSNNCIQTLTLTITEPPVMTISVASTPSTCGADNGTGTVTVNGGIGSYSYSWSPSVGASANVSSLSPGTYSVLVADGNSCSINAGLIIYDQQGPELTISSLSHVTCYGKNNGAANISVSGGTSPFTYSWNPSVGTIPNVTNLLAGTYTFSVTDSNNCIETETVIINEPASLALTATSTGSTCGHANGSASISATGGSSPYFYSWSPTGGSNQIANGLVSGQYTVYVTDDYGCLDSAAVSVSGTPGPEVSSINITNVSCYGLNDGEATLSVTSGTTPYTYSWSSSQGNTPMTNLLSAGSHTVTISDSNGCEEVYSFSVTEPPVIEVLVNTTAANCNQANGSASASVTGGSSPYTYSWSATSVNSSSVTGLNSGAHSVTISDNAGCSLISSFNITDPGAPSISLLSQNNPICNGSATGSAIVNVSGGSGPYTY